MPAVFFFFKQKTAYEMRWAGRLHAGVETRSRFCGIWEADWERDPGCDVRMRGGSRRADFRADRAGGLRCWRNRWNAGGECVVTGSDARDARECADGESLWNDDSTGD